MTTATYLGQHHAKVRKISLNPNVRGRDHARGRSTIKAIIKYTPQALNRYLRKRNRAANTVSKKELTSQYFGDALSSLDQLEEPVEEIQYQ